MGSKQILKGILLTLLVPGTREGVCDAKILGWNHQKNGIMKSKYGKTTCKRILMEKKKFNTDPCLV